VPIEQEATRSPKERTAGNRRIRNRTYGGGEDGEVEPASYPMAGDANPAVRIRTRCRRIGNPARIRPAKLSVNRIEVVQ